LSIHWPGRSARAARFSGRHSHFVSNRPIWLADAADPVIARSPITQRIAGSRIAGPRPPEYRLTEQADQPVAAALAGARIGPLVGQAQRVIQLAIGSNPASESSRNREILAADGGRNRDPMKSKHRERPVTASLRRSALDDGRVCVSNNRHAVRPGRQVLHSRSHSPARRIFFACSSISTAIRRRS